MKTVSMMGRNYNSALSYVKKENEVILGRSDEILAGIEKSGPYVVCDGTTITMLEIARAVSVCVCVSIQELDSPICVSIGGECLSKYHKAFEALLHKLAAETV